MSLRAGAFVALVAAKLAPVQALEIASNHDLQANTRSMRAFGMRVGGGVDVLEELEVPVPELQPRDLLVRVEAVGFNPGDFMIREMEVPPGGLPKILGWDGAGVVQATGTKVTAHKAGDRIYFAGSVIRNGSNADFVAIDERIVARAPASIPAAVAATVPMVTLTAWEGLEQLGLDPSQAGSGRQRRLLTIPGSGGIGSKIIQLAKACGVQVIATASREESRQEAIDLGADFVINHRKALKPQLEKLGIKDVHFIYDVVDFVGYQQQFGDIIQPFGKIVSAALTTQVMESKIEISDALISKSVAVISEAMFARTMFEAEDMGHQGEILTMAAQMIDDQRLQTPIWKSLPWSLESLRTAHDLLQSGKAIGKIVMTRNITAADVTV